MQIPRPLALLLLASTLIGCQSQRSESLPPLDPAGRCNASAVQDLIGEQASPALLDQARQRSGAKVARILRPDEVVTLEYNDQRLTLVTDESLEIQRIGCG